MSRGGSYGGGKSSLGYLFGSAHNPPHHDHLNKPPPPPSPSPCIPPYGTDEPHQNPTPPPPPSDHPKGTENILSNNNYQRSGGQNSGNFITGRPSTKVKSVPGGDSSLGYLFGDK